MLLRVNMRAALAALCALVLLLTLYWSRCELAARPAGAAQAGAGARAAGADIECSINGEYSVACRRDAAAGEVYVPFSFIRKYFEIYGKITSSDGVERLEWSHSYSKVYHPKKKYDPRGTFANFENYNVEVRDRVKCISGIEGVPVSTQWDPRGFYYPTQIAQFGLAHYSKNLTEPEPRVRVIDDGEGVRGGWVASGGAVFAREYDVTLAANVVRFSGTEQRDSKVCVAVNISQEFVLSVDVLLKPNSSLSVTLQNKDGRETVYLHYVTSTQLIYAQEDNIYHGVGVDQKWQRLTRDLIIDMQKGWALLDQPKRKSPRNKFRITCVCVRGGGAVGGARVSSSAHPAQFLAAARWLVRRQRARGGWPVPARRRVAPAVPDLMPGWHSAMSQGHAVSLLARAYHRSGDEQYLRAARRALLPLDVPAGAGGVRALWLDRYIWYEEYPTTPPLFVLNGFIYTLLGLYDLHVIEGENSISLAKKMFDDGMTSLKTLLPLFDTGSGSFYDLRHFTLGTSPNVARWDYHATHVNQLYILAGLDPDPVLINTAKRWEGYMQGKRAAHN